MTGQRFMGDSLGYWQGTVESGEIEELALWSDDTEDVRVILTRADLEIIEMALKRQFVAVKKDRTQVLHAVYTIRHGLKS